MAHNKLTAEQRVYVVKRLAAYESLLSIRRALQQDFGITLSPAAIAHYDPERSPDAQLGPLFFFDILAGHADFSAIAYMNSISSSIVCWIC